MKHLIVYSHPNPGSFNRAIVDAFSDELESAGHEVRVRDLYELGFDPVLSAGDLSGVRESRTADDVAREQEHVAWAEMITFIYPLWWAGMPAMAKGYFDRVFCEGFAYTFGPSGLEKRLADKAALTIVTLGDTNENYEKAGFLESMNRLMDGVMFAFPGLKPVGHVYFGAVPQVSDAERRKMLEKVRQLAREL